MSLWFKILVGSDLDTAEFVCRTLQFLGMHKKVVSVFPLLIEIPDFENKWLHINF